MLVLGLGINRNAVAACDGSPSREQKGRQGVLVTRVCALISTSPALSLLLFPMVAFSQQDGEGAADLAKELTNPVADLVTAPIQMNIDGDIGPEGDGTKITTNVQPLIPFDTDENRNLITQTIVPVIYQDDVFPGAGSQFGLGDISFTAFLWPKRPTAGGLTWGAGPVLLMPTATDSRLGAKKWGAGPAAVGLLLRGPWTMGMLANHVWSLAGDERPSREWRQETGQ